MAPVELEQQQGKDVQRLYLFKLLYSTLSLPIDPSTRYRRLWLLAIFKSLLLINKDDAIYENTSVATFKCSNTFLDGEDLTASCMCVSGIKNHKIHTNTANMSCAYCIYNLTIVLACNYVCYCFRVVNKQMFPPSTNH